ncbi:MAG: hypothetical protein RLZZ84_1940 [Pseudomonadota bacterium]|jgi:putative membrane protein
MAKLPTMTQADRDRVGAAVAAAERRSAGEIVTILAESSDTYHDVALLWSAAVGFIALGALAFAPDFYLGIIDRLTGEWETFWHPGKLFALALTVGVVKFTAMWLMQLWRPLRLILVPAAVKHARVRARAVTCFKIGAEARTHGHTGILIYLSLAERRAEIVADAAIAERVAPEVWGDAMAAMLAQLRQGQTANGLIAAVDRVGAVLAQHFPRAADDRNELPDRLIEV